MTLRSYSFMQEVNPRVWGILSEMPPQADCAVELVEASLDGRLDPDKSGVDINPFNFAAYDSKVNTNHKLAEYQKNGSRLSIISTEPELGEYGVSEAEASLAANQTDAYGEVDDKDEQEYAVRELDVLSPKLTARHKVDFWSCLKTALQESAPAIEKLKDVVANDPYVGSLLKVVLSGRSSAVSAKLAKVG